MNITPPLLEPGMLPPQQTGHLPSPLTPTTQSPRYPMAYEQQSCLQYLSDTLNRNQQVMHQQAEEIEERVTRNSRLSTELNRLKQDHERLQLENSGQATSYKRKLEELGQKHTHALTQASEARQKRDDLEKEVEELNDTYQREIDERGQEIAVLNKTVTFQQDELAEAKATIDRLEREEADHREKNAVLMHEAAAQTEQFTCLEQQVANSTALERANTKLELEKAALEYELRATGQIATMLDDAKKHLATEMATLELRYERANAVNAQLREEAEEATQLHVGRKSELQASEEKIRVSEAAMAAVREQLADAAQKRLELEDEVARLQESAVECKTLREELAGTAQEHEKIKNEMTELKAERMMSEASRSDLLKELDESKGCHIDRNKELSNLRKENAQLTDELKASSKCCAVLRNQWDSQMERAESAESKQKLEREEVQRLERELRAERDAVQNAKKEFKRVKTILNTTTQDLKGERAQLLKASQELSEAGHNAAKHFEARNAAESKCADAERKLKNSMRMTGKLERDLELAKREPQELRRTLNEERDNLRICGDKLRASLSTEKKLADREKGLMEQNEELQARIDRMLQAGQPSSMKRSRGSESFEDNRGSDSGPSSGKKRRVEQDSKLGASQWSHERSPYKDDRPLHHRRQW